MHPRTAQIQAAAAAFAVLAFVAPGAGADALIVTRAMLAGTIAEYFVEEGVVRLELEISEADVPAFANLLPDDVYASLDLPPRSFAERIATFSEIDLAIIADDGAPLPARLLEVGPRPRIRRDEVTGNPIEPDSETPQENAVFARLEYELPGRPTTLTLVGLRTRKPAAVGFVAYHSGVAVNDFRYLSPVQTLTLDWDDPWYSHFDRRSLRRQYFAPMTGFLYVEPYEVRKEIILRPLDLQRWIDLGLEEPGIVGSQVIPADQQREITRAIGEFLRDHHRVEIDGEIIEPELARVNFLERTLRTSRVVEPGTDVDVNSAVVGAIFVYPTSGLPQQVTMEWDLWDERITRVPVSSVDQAGGLPEILEPDRRVLVWQNFLKFPEMPTLEVLEGPPSDLARSMGIVRWVLLALLAALAMPLIRRSRAWQTATPARWIAIALVTCLTTAAFGWAWRTGLSQERAAAVVSGLLTNIYRAFDYRSEERIYDALAASTDGPVLEQTYLETRKGLELASQGGARARVKQIELVDLTVSAADGGGFVADATWNVAGAVGHWGHVHQRNNQYEAELTIAPVGGAWKLVKLEILREERR
jgi:hypothetical protein